MKSGTLPLLAWGCLQLVTGSGLAVWSDEWPALLLAGGSTPVFAIAAWNLARPPQPDRPRLLPGASLPVVLLAAGLATAALGFTAGLWLGLIGGEMMVFGGVWLGRELWAERRLARAAAGRAPEGAAR